MRISDWSSDVCYSDLVLKSAEAARKSDVLGAAHGLITQEQHFVQQQLSADFGEQAVIAGGVRQIDPGNFGPDGAGQWLNTHGELLRSQRWTTLWFSGLRGRGDRKSTRLNSSH